MFVFFFSSRRRHTRFDCDWSSDVCSSDLVFPAACPVHGEPVIRFEASERGKPLEKRIPPLVTIPTTAGTGSRSEERRVGKECRSRRSPDHEKKKQEEQKDEDGLRKQMQQR